MTNFVSSETALPPDGRGAVLLWQDRVAGRPADWAAERLLETGFLSNGRFVLPDSRTERDAWFAGLFALFPELSPLGEKLPLRSGDETIALVDRRLFRPLGLPTVCVRLWILEESASGSVSEAQRSASVRGSGIRPLAAFSRARNPRARPFFAKRTKRRDWIFRLFP